MRSKTRFIAVALLALVGLSTLGGCIVVPDGGGHHDRWNHDGDRDSDRGHRDWR